MSNLADSLAFEDDFPMITMEAADNPEASTVLWDEMSQLITPKKAAEVRQKIVQHIGNYIDRNSESLMAMGPYVGIFFDEEKDGMAILHMLGITPKQVNEIVKKSPMVKSHFRTLNNPLFYTMVMLICTYRSMKGKLFIEAGEMCTMFMAIRFYSSRQGYMWYKGCNKDCMIYTINNLTDKYLYKQEGSVYKVLKHLSEQNFETLGVKLIETHLDKFYTYFITNISSKINNSLGKIFDEYKKNLVNKKYMSEDKETFKDNESNSEVLKDLTNISADADTFADRVYAKIRTAPIDQQLLFNATSQTKIRASTVQSTIEDVLYNEHQMLKDFIICIIAEFIIRDPMKHTIDKVKSRYFHAWAMNVYKISNSKSDRIIKLKEILDVWIRKYGAQYMVLNREATIVNFRKSLFIYIVDCIIKYA